MNENTCKTRIIGLSNIATNRIIYITKEMADMLVVTEKDTVQFLLDEKGNINLARADIIKKGKILSFSSIIKHHAGFYITIPKTILEILEVSIKDSVLFILKDNNIIIKDSFLLPIGKVLTFSKIRIEQRVNIPKIIIEILGIKIHDMIVFIKKDDNIAVKKLNENEVRSEIIESARVGSSYDIYFKKEIRFLLSIKEDDYFRILDVGDLIWWMLDEFGDIIIKNSCINRRVENSMNQ